MDRFSAFLADFSCRVKRRFFDDNVDEGVNDNEGIDDNGDDSTRDRAGDRMDVSGRCVATLGMDARFAVGLKHGVDESGDDNVDDNDDDASSVQARNGVDFDRIGAKFVRASFFVVFEICGDEDVDEGVNDNEDGDDDDDDSKGRYACDAVGGSSVEDENSTNSPRSSLDGPD